MSAEDRAWIMLTTSIKDLPPLANKYAHYLCEKLGGCIDVYFLGYTHYAQAVEHLKPSDKYYQIDKDGRKWFKEHQC